MWVWIVTAIVIVVLAVIIFGCRRLNTARLVGPDEGIEDAEVAKGYDKISRWPQFKLLRKLVIYELGKCNPRGVIVDIGCGPGYLTADVLRAFPELSATGVDIAREMLERAAGNLGRQGLGERADFRQGDIQELPFEDGSVDFIVSTLSLHHWSEPVTAINEIHRVLKPESGFLLFDLRRDAPRCFYWLMKFAQTFILPSAMGRINEPISSALASYTADELRQMLILTPFKECSIRQGIFWSFVVGRKS
ncbi:class I SAM-dependent methyltransferase [Chloroflexota bacterium]